MKKLLALLLGLACSTGCIVDDGPRHHGREAGYEHGHSHCVGCGHVQVRGIWYIRD